MLLRVDLSTTIRIYLTENSMLCYGPLVSELGGRVHGAPNPVIGGGLCPLDLPAPPPMNLLRYRYISHFHHSLNKFDKKEIHSTNKHLTCYVEYFTTIVAETNSPSYIREILNVSLTKQVCTLLRRSRAMVHSRAYIVRLVSRQEMRPTDRHADEVTADATGWAVSGHLRSQVASNRSVCRQPWPRLHAGQLVAFLVSKSTRALCRSDNALLCGDHFWNSNPHFAYLLYNYY